MKGDIAIIKGVVELAVQGGAQVIGTTPNGSETARTQVASASILSTEKGPLKAVDKVSKTVQRNKLPVPLTGVIEHRTKKNFIMAAWNGEAEGPNVEKETSLTRL